MSTLPIYPRGDLDQGSLFLANLGSFWSDVYTGKDVFEGDFQAQLDLWTQNQLQYLETAAAWSRLSCPVFNRELWQVLTVYKSQVNSVAVNPLRYDGSSNYGDPVVYGQAASTPRWRVPIPDKLVDVQQVLNRPAKPSVVLTRGADFQVVTSPGRYLELAANPFDSGLFVTRSTVRDGVPDEALDLWLLASDYDLGLLYEQFGYALELYIGQSSEHYAQLINAYWDMLQQGPSVLGLRRGLAAICRLPVVIEPREQVEAVLRDPRRLQVVTDRHVYTFRADATPIVAVGDRLRAGDFLTDAVTLVDVADPRGGLASLPAIAVGRELSTLPLRGGLTFRNGLYPTSYSVDSDGFAVVTFTGVDGFAEDVAAFWAEAYRDGKATGNSVARALRTGPDTPGEPPAGEIPPQVNPMQFLLGQLLADGTFVLVVKTDQLGAGASLQDLKFLRRVLPGHVLLLTISQTAVSAESYTGVSEPGVGAFLTSEQDLTETLQAGTHYEELSPQLRLVQL